MMVTGSDKKGAGRLAEVIVESPVWASVGVGEAEVERAANALWARLGGAPGATQMSVLLTGDERIHALNAQFRAKDQPTNVLSFPSGEEEYIGDIALGADTVVREAKQLGVTVEDHVAHLVVHGTLHLLGYDHETNADAEEMESLEVLVLNDLAIANPYGERESDRTITQSETNEGAA